MNSASAVTGGVGDTLIKMRKISKTDKLFAWINRMMPYRGLLFLPLIIAGGRLAVRIVMNLWDMLEP